MRTKSGAYWESGAYWASRRSLPLRYGVAVASVAMATGLKLLIEPLLPQQAPFLLLAGAVMVAAWFGGLGPGLVATALGALSADYFYLAPVGSFTGLVGGAFWLQVLFVLQGGADHFAGSGAPLGQAAGREERTGGPETPREASRTRAPVA
jgi:uncharacterized protein DUF4118